MAFYSLTTIQQGRWHSVHPLVPGGGHHQKDNGEEACLEMQQKLNYEHSLNTRPKGDDEDFRAYVKSLIGKDYFGGDLPTEDFRLVWDEHNKDVYAKQDALAERREAAVAEAKANKEAGIATFKAIAEHLADPNWRNMDQIAKALGLNDIASAFGQLQNYGIDPYQTGGRRAIRAARRRCPLWPLGRDPRRTGRRHREEDSRVPGEAGCCVRGGPGPGREGTRRGPGVPQGTGAPQG